MLDLTRELIQGAATAVFGAPLAHTRGDDGRLVAHDISGHWPVRTVHGALSDALGEEIGPDTGERTLRRLCDRGGIAHAPCDTHGDVLLDMYERLVEEKNPAAHLLQGLPHGSLPAHPPAP
ncbi:hypothetical protein M877_03695 [Streptomyces niveus NCIMB 11891]|nr:hypothetical protein M877_03695 [Streptomyces niveus NCIMB 11891]